MRIRERLDKIKTAFRSSQDDSMQMLVSNENVTVLVNASLIQRRCHKKAHGRKALDTAKEQAFENALQHAIFVGNPALHCKLSQVSSIDSDYRPYSRASYWRGIHNLTPTMVSEASDGITLHARPMEPTLGDVFIVITNVLRERHRGAMCSFLAGETVAFLGPDEDDRDVWLVEAYNRTGKIHRRNLAGVDISSDHRSLQSKFTKMSSSQSSSPKLEQPHKQSAGVPSSRPTTTQIETIQPGLLRQSHSWPQMSLPGQSVLPDTVCIRGGGDEVKEPKPPSPHPGPTPPPSPAPPPPPPSAPEKSAKRRAAMQMARALEATRPSLPPRIVNIGQRKRESTAVSKQRADTPHQGAPLPPVPVPTRESVCLPPQRAPPLPPNGRDFGDGILDDNRDRHDYPFFGHDYETRKLDDTHITDHRTNLLRLEVRVRLLEDSDKRDKENIEERVRQLEESSEQDREHMEERFIRLAQGIESIKERYGRATDGKGRP